MAIQRVLTHPEPRLREKARPVEAINQNILTLLDDMAETMYAYQGVGLAATQIGVPLRVVVVDYSTDRSGLHCLINPEILAEEGTQEHEEGCLSVPGYYDTVKRPAQMTLRYLDREGNQQEQVVEEGLAACYSHEIEHLNGILFVDHLSLLKQKRIKKRLEKQMETRD